MWPTLTIGLETENPHGAFELLEKHASRGAKEPSPFSRGASGGVEQDKVASRTTLCTARSSQRGCLKERNSGIFGKIIQ